jgi:hypothetical protein
MSGTPMIKVDGLAEFQKSLRQIDADLPKQLRVMLNDAVTVVIDWAVPRIPRRTGRAAGSVKKRSSQREARVAMGGTRAPHMPWLDFGGKVGREDSVVRPFRREGRYLYPGLKATHEDVTAIMEKGLAALAAGAGLEVT